jgi:catechol 2,3-dioxygenase-like lactoylglutathione lyase family enzyme
MTAPLQNVGAITLFVEDPQGSKEFYERVLGVTAIFQDDDSAALRLENLVLNLLKAPAARELVAPAQVAPRDGSSRFQLTIWVDDADAIAAELRSRGVELLNGPMDREWGMRTASFADPDGHIWEVAAELSGD